MRAGCESLRVRQHLTSEFGEAFPLSVLVATSYPLLCDGLIGILNEMWPSWKFTQAASFEDATRLMLSVGCQLAFWDVTLIGPAGLETLSAAYPECLLVALGDSDDRTTILDCLEAGVHGYILKSATPMQALRAAETVLAGGVFAPASLAGKSAVAPVPRSLLRGEHDLSPVRVHFTDRQRDVLRLLTEGCPTKTIARRLNLAVGTVKVHLAAIYRVLGVQGRLEALARMHALSRSTSFGLEHSRATSLPDASSH